MSAIQRPDAQTLFDHIKDMMSATVLGGATVIPESNEWYVTALNYAMAEELFAIIDQAFQERDPETACDENVVAMAAKRGVYPYPATPAQGYVRLTGTAGTTLPAPLQFTIGGQTFVTAYDGTQVNALDANGEAYVRVRAMTPGTAGNVQATTGTLTTAIAGVNTTVDVLGGSFCGGSEAEDMPSFRTRFINRMTYHPRATNEWAKEKLLEWPCATRVIHRAGSCCDGDCDSSMLVGGAIDGSADCGSVNNGSRTNFYVMFDDTFENGIAPPSVLQEVEEWFYGVPKGFGLGEVEIGVCGSIVPVTAVPADVKVSLTNCTSATKKSAATAAVTEFFRSVEPSQPLDVSILREAVVRATGVSDAEVMVDLTNAADGYGMQYGPKVDGVSKVYFSGCLLEPDCDYMLTLNSVTVT